MYGYVWVKMEKVYRVSFRYVISNSEKKNLDDFYLSFYGDVPEVNELVN